MGQKKNSSNFPPKRSLDIECLQKFKFCYFTLSSDLRIICVNYISFFQRRKRDGFTEDTIYLMIAIWALTDILFVFYFPFIKIMKIRQDPNQFVTNSDGNTRNQITSQTNYDWETGTWRQNNIPKTNTNTTNTTNVLTARDSTNVTDTMNVIGTVYIRPGCTGGHGGPCPPPPNNFLGQHPKFSNME